MWQLVILTLIVNASSLRWSQNVEPDLTDIPLLPYH